MKAKTKAMPQNAVQAQAQLLKRKMISRRIFGILTCLIAIASIVLYYLKLVNDWICIINISYCIGSIFSANSFIQDIKVGNPWQRLNGLCAVLFYILVVFLIVYGFVTKELVLQF